MDICIKGIMNEELKWRQSCSGSELSQTWKVRPNCT